METIPSLTELREVVNRVDKRTRWLSGDEKAVDAQKLVAGMTLLFRIEAYIREKIDEARALHNPHGLIQASCLEDVLKVLHGPSADILNARAEASKIIRTQTVEYIDTLVSELEELLVEVGERSVDVDDG